MNEPRESMSFHLRTDPGGGALPAAAEAKTILVVDDYRSLCEMIASMLRPCGYRVLTATSAREAKALATENASIALLITDMEMPETRGDELADWFRAAKAESRVLFMSSQPALRKAVEPFPFLQKPFRAEALIRQVHELLNPSSPSSAETTTPKNHGN